MREILLCISLGLSMASVCGQTILPGIVFIDSSSKKPADSALVYAANGGQCYTDTMGRFVISMLKENTIWVYYKEGVSWFRINQPTIDSGYTDIYLNRGELDSTHVNVLRPVYVTNSTYRKDSIANRQEYADIFNYKKQALSMGNNKWKDSVNGIPLDTKNKKLTLLDVGSMLGSREGKQKARLQKRLLKTEQENYVAQVFTPALVEQYSGMHDDDSLHMFINKYSPPYSDIINMNELDLALYIKKYIAVFRKEQVKKDLD